MDLDQGVEGLTAMKVTERWRFLGGTGEVGSSSVPTAQEEKGHKHDH